MRHTSVSVTGINIIKLCSVGTSLVKLDISGACLKSTKTRSKRAICLKTLRCSEDLKSYKDMSGIVSINSIIYH